MNTLRTAALAVAATLVCAGGGTAAATSTSALPACVAAVSANATVPDSVVTDACAAWVANPAGDVVPTFVAAWVAVGGIDGEAGDLLGWPVAATCVLLGVPTGPTTAYYVLAGAAVAAGPATASRLSCSAPAAGLSFVQTVPGAASAGVDASTSPMAPQRTQTVCVKGEAWYSVHPTYASTGALLGNCSPAPR